MTEPIIKVNSLSKAYRLGKAEESYDMLRDALVNMIKAPLRRIRELGRSPDGDDQFWALRDVSFEVTAGEVLGIVGRNGAGKSTLLKVLSRITEPTGGEVELRGRVASLLEVGTGFHPELTGRENIFLNGAILGMRRTEIVEKFDEIVQFAEIEDFLDTPVKRYSSGMYVRLAFAVAAHLDPEILIVDEVLAVGDVEFQAKCLGKMRDIAQGGGRTVLFVSHNLPAVTALCSSAILLDQGRLIETGGAEEIVSSYLSRFRGAGEDARVTTSAVVWKGIRNRAALDRVRADEDLEFELEFETGAEPLKNLQFDFELVNDKDVRSVHCRSKFLGRTLDMPSSSRIVVRYRLSAPRLAPGHYNMIIYIAAGGTELCWVEQINACTISGSSTFVPGTFMDGVKGAIVPDFDIKVEANADVSSTP